MVDLFYEIELNVTHNIGYGNTISISFIGTNRTFPLLSHICHGKQVSWCEREVSVLRLIHRIGSKSAGRAVRVG